MTTVKELNEAIEILKAECESHVACTECPMCDNCQRDYCYALAPCNWETIKRNESDA